MADSNTTTKLIDLDNLSTYHSLMDAKKEEHSIILTLAQYNALTPEEKMNGKTYYISDAGSSGMVITASDVLMTGYSKASSASAITTNDTGSIAFGKLEKGLEDTNSDVDDIEALIPSSATTSNKLATAADIPGVATASTVGLVKPDGTTTTIDANGVISASGATALSALTDTSISSPSDGQILGFNGITGKWENQNPSGGSTPYDGRKTRYTISASNWSSSPNSDGYYTYSLTLTNPLTTNTSPNVYIAGASDNTQPTATESTMFSYVKRCNLSSTTTLVLYASTKPTSTFYVFVGAEGGGSGEVYSTTETVIGTWKGQTLYRKIIEFGTLPNNGLKDVSTGFGRYAIKVVNTCVICRNSSNVNVLLPFVSTSSGGAVINFRYDNNGGYLCAEIQTNFDATEYTECDVIMEYIKV